jgi:hypothetical protein
VRTRDGPGRGFEFGRAHTLVLEDVRMPSQRPSRSLSCSEKLAPVGTGVQVCAYNDRRNALGPPVDLQCHRAPSGTSSRGDTTPATTSSG